MRLVLDTIQKHRSEHGVRIRAELGIETPTGWESFYLFSEGSSDMRTEMQSFTRILTALGLSNEEIENAPARFD